ncbi:alpha/beta hydrolase [Rummeliibacillus sp. NPDC094406]|uniref:alpha/beta hydrolase n=1 Tax=Rummeliibacillus sp. NPDC094406 TaxID=3364511 RepID=UPI003812E872
MKKLWFLLVMVILLTACGSKDEVKKEGGKMDEKFLGEWAGDIEIPQSPLTINLKLDSNEGSLSVPVQGLKNYPFESITYDGNKVDIMINLQGSKIKILGELKKDIIEGTLIQNGQTFAFKLKPFEEQPLLYNELSIPVENGQLKSALQKPTKNEKSYPVAIIISGSGATDKDGNTAGMGKNDSLKMLAEGLADEGIASIRYDKRGIGENISLIKKEEDLSIEQYVDDVLKIMAYIKSNQQFKEIYIIGHSEGSLIGMLAAKNADIASFISLAGAGRPADELLLEQLEGQLTPALMTETKDILSSLKNGQPVQNVSTELQALFRPSVQPYLMSWLKYDPSKSIQDVKSPVFIIQGTNDLQVSEKDAQALKAGKNNAKLVYIDGMNHVLKNAPADKAGNIATYTNPKLPLHDDLVPSIVKFITK